MLLPNNLCSRRGKLFPLEDRSNVMQGDISIVTLAVHIPPLGQSVRLGPQSARLEVEYSKFGGQ